MALTGLVADADRYPRRGLPPGAPEGDVRTMSTNAARKPAEPSEGRRNSI
jgi:hypothetical protein